MSLYSVGSILGFLAIPIIISIIIYVNSKDIKKSLIVFAILVVAIGGFKWLASSLSENSDETENDNIANEEQEAEPVYYDFGDISFQLNQDTNFYTQIDNYTEFNFKNYDKDNNLIEWTDEEKKDYWENMSLDSPFEQVFFQDSMFPDVVSLAKASSVDFVYSTIDEFANAYTNEIDEEYERSDSTIGNTHICTIYYDDDGADSMFLYKDNLYIIFTDASSTDKRTLVKETLDTIRLN